jgi:hypothetical protein
MKSPERNGSSSVANKLRAGEEAEEGRRIGEPEAGAVKNAARSRGHRARGERMMM